MRKRQKENQANCIIEEPINREQTDKNGKSLVKIFVLSNHFWRKAIVDQLRGSTAFESTKESG